MNFEAASEAQTLRQSCPTPSFSTTRASHLAYLLPSTLASLIRLPHFTVLIEDALIHRAAGSVKPRAPAGGPISLNGLMLRKLAPYFVIGLIDVAAFLLIMRWVFGVPISSDGDAVAMILTCSTRLLARAFPRYLPQRICSKRPAAKGALFTLPNFFRAATFFPLTGDADAAVADLTCAGDA
jgi:hypothetical protein